MKYIAYGSNMNLAQMSRRCPMSRVIEVAELRGWKLVFKYHADIIYTGDNSDVVPVVIWDINDKDWYMLDSYEGYPHYYGKRTVNVTLHNGESISAIVYTINNNLTRYEIPTKKYFDIIIEGCKDNGIDVKYLYNALVYTYGKIGKGDALDAWLNGN